MSLELTTFHLPGRVLQRGFWLYVWEVTPADDAVCLYVGRTGDESSTNAQAPFARMSAHLGSNPKSNALRRNLLKANIDPERCVGFDLTVYGPIFAECADWDTYRVARDAVAALEKKLADSLDEAGYRVLNRIACRRALDSQAWELVRAAFAERFPKLAA